MLFAKNNPDAFYGQNGVIYPTMVAHFKCVGGIITEIVNIIVILQSNSVIDCVKDFIALGLIAEIDEYMIYTVSKSNIDYEREIG